LLNLPGDTVEVAMLESIRKAVLIPTIPLEGTVAVGTGAAFVWLLAKGYIKPLAVYFLELYLSF
jgi:hypothetical protein